MLRAVIIVCAAAPIITKYDPLKTNVYARLQPPSEVHILGTDHFGRDVYSRILYGGRRLLAVAFLAVGLGLLLGLPLGLFAGYAGGVWDGLAMRIVDALLAFPGILLVLLFMALAQAYKLDGVTRDGLRDILDPRLVER